MIFGFVLVYALISFANHLCFRTYGLDLGLYTNAMYDYAHGSMANMDMIWDTKELALADHFDLYLILFSPLVYLFGSWTLLVIQIAAILVGAKGVHTYFKDQPRIALFATFFFMSYFGVFSALSYDYHSNVIGAMAVPWLFYFAREKRFVATLLVLIFIWIGKENMGFWMTFVMLGLALVYRKDRKSSLILLGFSFASFCYFMLVIKVLMPSLSVEGEYLHFAYESLGESMSEAFIHLITHPIDSLEIFFTNHLPNSRFDGVKAESHIILLISGVVILIRRPAYLLMLAPIYFQKFFHDQPMTWSTGAQYSIEFAPILAIGVFEIIRGIEVEKRKKYSLWGVAILSLVCTFRVCDQPFDHVEESNIQFYKGRHYSRDYNIAAVSEAIEMIPDEAAVCAQNPYLPHVALRDNVFMFPYIKSAKYILVSSKEYPFPLQTEELTLEIERLKADTEWTLSFEKDGVYLFQSTTD
ncbi:MAG: DUF2079 domain-containing protein [Crocinitomicaceae bacterium]|nr:DUF2079 domain-containing protein [Crocinitomicaceae bacterium]